ncbi:MAG: ParB/RepB/Spo0J family partition protein [Clostridia bacterium]|nr:ParB/RepB/Spo0J family partition protein [Clostridia bacterium]
MSEEKKTENKITQPSVEEIKENDKPGDKVYQIEIGLIDRNEEQPRKIFDEKALKELAVSIKQHGIIQPLILQKNGERYIIVAGERRFRAARIAGLKAVPAIVKDYNKREVSEIAIIENLQREDLNPIESAKAIKNLIDEFNLTQEDVADKIGKSRPAVANTLRLLTLPQEIVEFVENNKLSAGHARTLLSVENDAQKVEIAKICIQKKLSVRDLEVLIKKLQKPAKSNKKVEQSLELKDFANNLNKILSTKVSIIGNDKKGRIYIDYYSQDDLQRIYDILNK